MIIISTGDTSLGLKLSLSFKLQLLLFFPFFWQCTVRAKWTEVEEATGQKELLKNPTTRGPRIPLGNISPCWEAEWNLWCSSTRSLAVVPRCLAKIYRIWGKKNLCTTAQFYYKYHGKKNKSGKKRLCFCVFDSISKTCSPHNDFWKHNTILGMHVYANSFIWSYNAGL